MVRPAGRCQEADVAWHGHLDIDSARRYLSAARGASSIGDARQQGGAHRPV